jgi:hypothetical protein
MCLNKYCNLSHFNLVEQLKVLLLYEDSTLSTFAYKPAPRNKQVQTLVSRHRFKSKTRTFVNASLNTAGI